MKNLKSLIACLTTTTVLLANVAHGDLFNASQAQIDKDRGVLMCFSQAKFGFDASAKGFSLRNAYKLGILAQLAYLNPKTVEADLVPLGFDLKHKFLEAHRLGIANTQAFVAENRDYAVLAFRGTEVREGVVDVFTDVFGAYNLKPKGEFGNVHAGFYTALDIIWDQVRAELESLPAGKPVFVTGHSLGAAVAVLAAIRIKSELPKIKVAGLYDFGQPRVGDRGFAKKADDFFVAAERNEGFAIGRFVNENDAVPLMGTTLAGYVHANEGLRYFDKSGKLLEGSAAVQASGALLLPHVLAIGDWQKNHRMRLYLTRIAGVLGKDLSACAGGK
jgi:surfactin synthase thioesterase subunit